MKIKGSTFTKGSALLLVIILLANYVLSSWMQDKQGKISPGNKEKASSSLSSNVPGAIWETHGGADLARAAEVYAFFYPVVPDMTAYDVNDAAASADGFACGDAPYGSILLNFKINDPQLVRWDKKE